MRNDRTGTTQREGEEQKNAGENEKAAEERLFLELLLSFPVHFPSNPRSEMKGNEEVVDIKADDL